MDQTTIVITTHYIEEARQAHLVYTIIYYYSTTTVCAAAAINFWFTFQVGLMRDGTLLAEAPPNSLIQVQNLPVSTANKPLVLFFAYT